MIGVRRWLDQVKSEKDCLIRIHHRLMSRYGWIPFNEFIELPIPTLVNLLRMIAEDEENEARMLMKMKSRTKR